MKNSKSKPAVIVFAPSFVVMQIAPGGLLTYTTHLRVVR